MLKGSIGRGKKGIPWDFVYPPGNKGRGGYKCFATELGMRLADVFVGEEGE